MSKASMKKKWRSSSKSVKTLGFLSSGRKKITWGICCWGKGLEKLGGWREFRIYGHYSPNPYFCCWYLVSSSQPHKVKSGIATRKQSLKSVFSPKRAQVEKSLFSKVLGLMTQKSFPSRRKKLQWRNKKFKLQKVQRDLNKRNSRLRKRKNSCPTPLSPKRRRSPILLKTSCMSWRIAKIWRPYP